MFADGAVVVGDAAQLVNPLNQEGGNLAMLSGKLAAQAIIEAKANDDFSAMSLSRYRDSWTRRGDGRPAQDPQCHRRAPATPPAKYPRVLSAMFEEYLRVDGLPKKSRRRSLPWPKRSPSAVSLTTWSVRPVR